MRALPPSTLIISWSRPLLCPGMFTPASWMLYNYYQDNRSCIFWRHYKPKEIKVEDRRALWKRTFRCHFRLTRSRSPFETWYTAQETRSAVWKTWAKTRLSIIFCAQGHARAVYPSFPIRRWIFTYTAWPLSRSKHTMHEQGATIGTWQFFPRITIWAGFEYATGIPVNPIPPEVTAKFLRRIVASLASVASFRKINFAGGYMQMR